MLQRHLNQLIEELQLGSVPSLDGQKGYSLQVGKFLVALKDLDPGVYFFAKIASVPEQKKEEFFIYLMKANFIGQGTGGSTLGLAEDESFLTLSLTLPYELGYLAFKEALEDFINFVDYWKRETEAFAQVK